jgi:hypothetical protein
VIAVPLNEGTRPPTVRARGIGPLGTAARAAVGLVLLGSVAWGHLARGFHPSSWALGLLGFPALLLAVQWLRVRRTPTRLEATGPISHVVNLAAFVVLYLLEPTSDATLLFYGASMLLAALRGDAGCEVLALPNWLLHRDDQVGCAVFWPIDRLEHHRIAAAVAHPAPVSAAARCGIAAGRGDDRGLPRGRAPSNGEGV